jgi:hypothetical protein
LQSGPEEGRDAALSIMLASVAGRAERFVTFSVWQSDRATATVIW